MENQSGRNCKAKWANLKSNFAHFGRQFRPFCSAKHMLWETRRETIKPQSVIRALTDFVRLPAAHLPARGQKNYGSITSIANLSKCVIIKHQVIETMAVALAIHVLALLIAPSKKYIKKYLALRN